MKLLQTLSLALLFAASAPVAAQSALPKAAVGERVTAEFSVEAVDPATRRVTLKAADGSVRTIKAGPDVKNLAQVKVGDRVRMTYVQAIALELKKGGTGIRSAVVGESASSARLGEKPAGMAERHVTVVGTVEKVDPATRRVTVKGPQGNLVDVSVADPAKLKAVKVGDEVELTYQEALAITVSAAEKN